MFAEKFEGIYTTASYSRSVSPFSAALLLTTDHSYSESVDKIDATSFPNSSELSSFFEPVSSLTTATFFVPFDESKNGFSPIAIK